MREDHQKTVLSMKLDSEFDNLVVPLVGNFYRSPTAQKIYKSLKKGDLVFLVFDPTNKFDKNAIKVLSKPEGGKSHHLGFVDRTSAANITKRLNKVLWSYDVGLKDLQKIDIEFYFEVHRIDYSELLQTIKIKFVRSTIF